MKNVLSMLRNLLSFICYLPFVILLEAGFIQTIMKDGKTNPLSPYTLTQP